MFIPSRSRRSISIVSATVKLLQFNISEQPKVADTTTNALTVGSINDVNVIPPVMLSDIKTFQDYVSKNKIKNVLVAKNKLSSQQQNDESISGARQLGEKSKLSEEGIGKSVQKIPSQLQSVQANQLANIAEDLESAPSISMSEFAEHVNEHKRALLREQTSPNMPDIHEQPGELEQRLFELVRHNKHTEVLELLETHHALNLKARIGKGSSVLHVACMNGNLGIVTALLDHGADVNARSSNGSTPLHWAAGNGHQRVVQLQLTRNADPSLLSSTWCVDVFGKDSGQQPLHWAVASGHHHCAELLLDAYPHGTGAVDERLNTPLELARKDNHTKTVDLLSERLNEEYVQLNVKEMQYDISKLWL